MLYNEFIENTGCKDTEYNYSVYKQLEVLYMSNDNISKQAIYEAGKKLVDNSKTAAEIEAEKNINDEIEKYNNWIDDNKTTIDHLTGLIERHTYYMNNCYYTEKEKAETIENIKYWKNRIKYYKDINRGYKMKIKNLQFILK